MEITKHLNTLYDHLFHKDIDRMGKKQYIALFGNDASKPVAYYLLDLLKAYGIAKEYIKWNQLNHRKHAIIFNLDMLYALKDKGITKQRKVSFDTIICKLYDQTTKEYTKEGLHHLILRVSGLTSNTSINAIVSRLSACGYVEYINGLFKFTHKLHNHTPLPTPNDDGAYEIIKKSDISEIFRMIPRKRFHFSRLRLLKRGFDISIDRIRKAVSRLISEGNTEYIYIG